MNTADTAPVSAGIEPTLRRATGTLHGRSDSPRLDAEVLLAHILCIPRAGLIARSTQALNAYQASAFDALIAQRLGGTPVAYLIGSREFWSMTLHVSPAVLVPRPETEILIEQTLSAAPAEPPRSVLDLGAGSGAVALAIAAERPGWTVTAVDSSSEALAVAQRNARDLKILRIRWLLGSWFEPLPNERFDLIVSNPPYVASGDPALRHLKDEPLLALTPGPTGLEALQVIIEQAPAHLPSGGRLFLEHGHDQAAAVQQLLQAHGFASIGTRLDLAGKSRVTFATLYTTPGNL